MSWEFLSWTSDPSTWSYVEGQEAGGAYPAHRVEKSIRILPPAQGHRVSDRALPFQGLTFLFCKLGLILNQRSEGHRVSAGQTLTVKGAAENSFSGVKDRGRGGHLVLLLLPGASLAIQQGLW